MVCEYVVNNAINVVHKKVLHNADKHFGLEGNLVMSCRTTFNKLKAVYIILLIKGNLCNCRLLWMNQPKR